DRVNRLPEQTQRRVYGCATSARQRGGGGQRFENTTTTSQRTRLVIRIDRKHSSGVSLPPVSHHIALHGIYTRYA
ncbi:hypothetical protein K469DRAFT_703115, partial [Zopfia rhizophila CBS 207.26]